MEELVRLKFWRSAEEARQDTFSWSTCTLMEAQLSFLHTLWSVLRFSSGWEQLALQNMPVSE